MLDTKRRDAAITAAIASGKFSESRRAHWQAQYDRDPAGTEQTLAALASGLVAAPVPAAQPFHSPFTPDLFPDLAPGQRRQAPTTAFAAAPAPVVRRDPPTP